MEDALYKIESMRRLAGLELIYSVLEDCGLLLKGGTMVDATIIHAPTSTKNRPKRETSRYSRPRRATSGTSA
jgi:IS5 family transposase